MNSQFLHVKTCVSTCVPSYAGSTSFNGICPPQARQTIFVVITLGDRCVSMEIPLSPACIGASATVSEKQKLENAPCHLFGGDFLKRLYAP